MLSGMPGPPPGPVCHGPRESFPFFLPLIRLCVSTDIGGVNYEKAKKILAKSQCDIWSFEKLIIPCNVNGSHWLLAVATSESDTIEVYNSLDTAGGESDECAKHVRK
eukprot:GHVU01227441.1.p1 GENE.GHVU01227441.1~~GHVU01227441.1.p1  ORF type:complete len:107 (-),score=3.62 GHVU01227441.1:2063-2383(-)